MNTNLLYVYLLFSSLFATSAFAIPGLTTYQARIIQPNGVPLESNGVSFRFTILNPVENCILYVEDHNAINMNNTSGLVTFSLGSGTKIYPTSGTLTFQDVFNNSSAPLACQASGTYGPGANDVRKIVMQFNDSNGWQTLPAMSINAVPYAMFATDAQKLGGVSATSYVNYSAIPTCTASQALQYTGSGFLCITAGGGSASGTITAGDITTALGYTPADAATLSASYTTVAASYSTVTATVSTLSTEVASLAALVSGTSNFSSLDLGSVSATGILAEARLPSFANVTSGSQYTKVTVDGKGRITSGAQLSTADVTTALGYTPASASASSQWATSGTSINYMTGYVGIGTASPLQSFSVSGIGIVTGNYGSGEDLVVSGEGSRMFFYPKKAAFRAGYVGNDEWDDTNIGESSVAIGDSSIATGYGAVALGAGTLASGTNSVALGKYSQALGDRSTAFGEAQAVGDLSTAFDSSYAEGMYSIAMGSSSANADRAIAMGSSANADGESSVAIGQSIHSRAYRSVAVGSYNVGAGSGTAWVATDPIFEVGNSQNGSPRSNAMTILKNGNIGIGIFAPVTKLEVSGGVKISMEAAACAVSYAGTLRYNSGNVEYCNGTSWAAFSTGGAVTSASIAAALSYTPANQSTVATSFTTLTNSVNIAGTSMTTLTSTVNNLSTSFTNLAAAVSGIATGAKVARVATTANIVLSGLQTIDTIVTLVAGDRVLVKNQSAQANNGLYIAAAGAWTRAPELDTWQEVLGAEVYVADGLSNQGIAYMVNTSVLSGTLNTTSIQWTTRGANWFNGNIGFGLSALAKNISGFDNAAFGNYSLSVATTGSENTGVGNYTFEDLTTGGKNTAVGTSAMGGVSSGSLNTALGYRALASVGTGDGNIGIGANAGWLITTGSNNVVIGSNTGAAIATSSNNILLADGQGNERMRITSSGAVGFGTTTPTAGLEVSGGVKLSGTIATLDIPLTTSTTGYITMNSERLLHASEDYSIFLGRGAGNLAGTGVQDTGIGHKALKSITLGYQNVAVGDFAMADMTIGGENTAIGSEALTNSVSGNANVAVGIQALMNNTSNENTVVGAYALNRTGNGSKNTGSGYAVFNMLTTGSNNVAAGWMALRNVTTGSSNIGIGYNAGTNLTTGSGNVVIGANTGASFATESNNISFNDGVGNERIRVVSSGLVGIGLSTPVTKLDVSGAIRISMDSATCATSYAGAIRYNAGNMQLCNGTTWASLGGEVTSASVVSALGYTPAASGSGSSQWTTSSTTISYMSGNVGIGIANPTSPLHVVGNQLLEGHLLLRTGNIYMDNNHGIRAKNAAGTEDRDILIMSSSNQLHLMNNTDGDGGDIIFNSKAGGVESMRITPAGHVGIGTGSPAARLAIEGTGAVGLQIKTTGAGAADTFNLVNDMDATGNFWFAKGSSNTVPTSPNRLMNITNWGNVEIFGQEVNNTNDNSGILSLKTQASADGGQRNEVSLEFYGDRTDLNTLSGYLGYESNTTFDLTLMNSKNGKLILGTSNTAAVTITSASAVGIGTTTPDSALTINSNNTKTTLHLTAMGGGGYLSARGNTSQLDVFGGYEYDLAAANYKARATAAAGVEFNAGTFRAYTNSGLTSGNTFTPTERLRIDTSGNVGIGTSSPGYLLDVNGNSALRGTVLGNAYGILAVGTAPNNGFYSPATNRLAFTANGTEAMRIDYTGNVGIGTASPTYKLHVNGTFYSGAATVESLTSAGQIKTAHSTATMTDFNNAGIVFNNGSSSYSGIGWAGISAFNSFLGRRVGGDDIIFGTLAGGPIVERVRFSMAGLDVTGSMTATGNVGIGTTTPLAKLHIDTGISTTSYTGIKLQNAFKTWTIGNNVPNNYNNIFSIFDGTTSRLWIGDTGNVGIGVINPSYRLDVSGTIRGFGITDSSDIRLKKDIEPLDLSLEKILKVKGVSYYWIDKSMPKKQIGFVAQDLEKIYPELVETDNKGMKSVNYSHLVAPVVEAVKSLYEKVMVLFDRNEQLAREVAAVKAENAEKTKQLNDIRAYLCSKDPNAPMCK